jgi:hypothetical protein
MRLLQLQLLTVNLGRSKQPLTDASSLSNPKRDQNNPVQHRR